MITDTATGVYLTPPWGTALSQSGLRSFPTVACGLGPAPCPDCRDCGNDCVNCPACERDECPLCAVPDLTPRTANTLVISGMTLAAHTRKAMQDSSRAVFLYHLVRAFEHISEQLMSGKRPWPDTLAEQLCMHLTISYGTDLACNVGEAFDVALPYSDYDYYFDRLYDTLLADDEHMSILDAMEPLARPDRIFDFDALASRLPDATIARLLMPIAKPFPETPPPDTS